MAAFQKPSFGKQPSRSSAEAAEEIAVSALVFLTEDPGRLSRFLGETGLSPSDLAARAGSPLMLGAVLDYLMSDESLLLVFASHAGIEPGAIATAHAAIAAID